MNYYAVRVNGMQEKHYVKIHVPHYQRCPYQSMLGNPY